MTTRSPAAVWRVTPDLLLALDDRLGSPLDGYVNGTQTWLSDDGPRETTLEWRLHPVAGYTPPSEPSHYELFDTVVAALRAGASPDALSLGGAPRALTALWDGLECFPAYGDEIEPAVLAAATTATLGIPPDAAGLVDHERIGDAWERSHRGASIVAMLLDELAGRSG